MNGKARLIAYAAVVMAAWAALAPGAFCDSHLWTISTGTGINRTSPAIGPDGAVYVLAAGRLYSLDPATGAENWKCVVGSVNNAGIAIASDGTIYVNNESGLLYAIKPDGTEKWRASTVYSYGGPAIGSDGSVYLAGDPIGDHGEISAIGSDGVEKWRYASNGGSMKYCTPAIGPDGGIYALDITGSLYAVDPAGAEKWRIENDEAVDFMSPAVGSDGTVYYATHQTLYAVDPEDQSYVWTYDISELNAEFRFAGGPVLGPDPAHTVYIAYYWYTYAGGGILGFDDSGARIYRSNKVTALGISLGDVYGIPLLTRSGQLIFCAGTRVLSVSQTAQDLFSFVYEHPDAGDEDAYFWYTSPVMDDEGRFFLCSRDGKVWGFSTNPADSPADSAWPMRSRDIRHTACAAEENHAPTLEFSPDSPQDILAGEPFTLTVTSADPDAGDLVSLAASNLPAGAVFNPGAPANPAVGILTFTPAAAQEGQNLSPMFTATDDRTPSMGTSDTFTIGVLPNNTPALAFEPESPLAGDPGDELTVNVTAQDPDAGDTVTLSVENLPANAFFQETAGNPANGTFTFTPDAGQACQSFTVTFTATDDGAPQKADTAEFTVDVGGCGPANVPPELRPIGDKRVCVGEELGFMVTATDANEGQTLAFEALGLPDGAVFENQVFAWTPAAGQEGDHQVTIRVCDDGLPQGCDEEAFSITVGPGATQESATGTGDIHVGLPDEDPMVAIEDLAVTAPADIAHAVPEGAAFPDGLISFTIKNLTPGATVTIVLTMPTDYANAQYYLVTDKGYEAFEGAVINGNQVVLTKTDGGAGDLDGVVNGEIKDPGGPALLVAVPQEEAAAASRDSSGSNCFIGALLP